MNRVSSCYSTIETRAGRILVLFVFLCVISGSTGCHLVENVLDRSPIRISIVKPEPSAVKPDSMVVEDRQAEAGLSAENPSADNASADNAIESETTNDVAGAMHQNVHSPAAIQAGYQVPEQESGLQEVVRQPQESASYFPHSEQNNANYNPERPQNNFYRPEPNRNYSQNRPVPNNSRARIILNQSTNQQSAGGPVYEGSELNGPRKKPATQVALELQVQNRQLFDEKYKLIKSNDSLRAELTQRNLQLDRANVEIDSITQSLRDLAAENRALKNENYLITQKLIQSDSRHQQDVEALTRTIDAFEQLTKDINPSPLNDVLVPSEPSVEQPQASMPQPFDEETNIPDSAESNMNEVPDHAINQMAEPVPLPPSFSVMESAIESIPLSTEQMLDPQLFPPKNE